MPSKKIYVKPYEVKGHHRIIHTRTFKFICAHCDKEAERETYATVCPKYGNRCNSNKAKCLRHQIKPNDRLKLSEVKPEEENKTKTVEDNSQKVQPTTPAVAEDLPTPVSEAIEELEPIETEKLIEYLNTLFINTYNNKLNSDRRYILVDLWHDKSDEAIAKKRKMRVKAVKKIKSKLIEELSNALKEDVTESNFHSIIEKHYRAYELIQKQLAAEAAK